MNPRRIRKTQRGPKRLKNLPAGLRRYWQRVRSAGRSIANPRKPRRRARTVTTTSRSVRRINPRSSTMAARRRKGRHLTAHQRRSRAARKAARTRRRMRSFGSNPRRVRHHYRTRGLRNPRRFGGGGQMRIKHLAVGAGVGMIGAVGLDYLWQYASGYLPASLQTGYIGTFTKAGVAVGAGWLASKVVGKQAAAGGVLGALTVIAYQLVHQMIAQAVPTAAIASTTTTATPAVAGLNAYMPRGPLGWVSPGTPLALRGLGNMRAYMQPAGAPAPVNVGRPGGSVNMSGLASPGSW